MFDEFLKEIGRLSQEIEAEYRSEKKFNEENATEIDKRIVALESIFNNKNLDHYVTFLAGVAALHEAFARKNRTSHLIVLNLLVQQSAVLTQSITAIFNELSQLKQPTSVPLVEAKLEKIGEIETELTKLSKEFKRYSPTLRKFKQALDQTEKTLRDNR
jgi:phosphopantetheinyl transferase (holo-ACP synthase)